MSKNRYIVFDVETPNRRNERMSAIGISVIEDGIVTEDYYSLVDPEQEFEDFNIQLTGITPESVAGKPTFADLWPDIEKLFSRGVVVAHGAGFDMSVVSKCLRAYGIEGPECYGYIDTLTLSRNFLPELPNHRLNTICDHLDICLDHHNAGSDCHATAEMLAYFIHKGYDVNSFCSTYDFKRHRSAHRSHRKYHV